MESDQNLNQLKTILDNLAQPANLNNHPWVRYRFVSEFCRENPAWKKRSQGSQLVEAVTRIFEKLRPGMPPRQGLRLDTRWGEFGLLAAQYFSPYRFGTPRPTTLREAWQNIDLAILLFVFGRQSDVSEEDRRRYQLIGGESEVAANSTISDWHRKGLEHLAGVINHYENSLVIRDETEKSRGNPNRRIFHRVVKLTGLLLVGSLLITMVLAGFSGWRIMQRLRSIEQNSQILLDLSDSLSDPGQLEKAGQTLSLLRSDLQTLQNESSVLLKVAPHLGWIPRYGGEISQAPQLLELALQLSKAGDEVYHVVAPGIPALKDKGTTAGILELMSGLQDGGIRLVAAQSALSQAGAARTNIRIDRLSPRFHNLFVEKIDPLLSSMQGAFPVDELLSMARLAPRLLGAVGNGPQTYLIMIQNEDELRPTGGFLTAIGRLMLENGRMTELSFESSEQVDDLAKPYPKAPWQLDAYMMAEMLLLRDANWFSDFPTTVEWVRFLYAYSRPQPIHGVIALDQQVIVELLRVVGPLQVEGAEEQISAENVLNYMRTAKEQVPPESVSAKDWNRKQFISRLAEPLINQLIAANSQTLQQVTGSLVRLLDEKHILLLADDPEMQELIIRRGWDGSIHPPQNSDYLQVIDTNVGFNKTNAVMDLSLDYSLDLTDIAQPSARLTTRHTNNATGYTECIQFNRMIADESPEKNYRINDCYWAYLRIYTPAGTMLTASTPHSVPAGWQLREQEIPARTDTLEENIAGTQSYGTLLVVPQEQSVETSFSYLLPSTVLTHLPDETKWIYRIKVQKQPGTKAVPLNIHIRLPAGYTIVNPLNGLQETQDGWNYNSNLLRDGTLEIQFGRQGVN